jgi:hypothetical protein
MVSLAGSEPANGPGCSRLPRSNTGLTDMDGLVQQRGKSAVLSVEMRIVPRSTEDRSKGVMNLHQIELLCLLFLHVCTPLLGSQGAKNVQKIYRA